MKKLKTKIPRPITPAEERFVLTAAKWAQS